MNEKMWDEFKKRCFAKTDKGEEYWKECPFCGASMENIEDEKEVLIRKVRGETVLYRCGCCEGLFGKTT